MQRWEYVRFWHRANWTGHQSADGWDRWVTLPEGVEAPDRDADDLDALNRMGAQGWEVIWVEIIWDMPPNVTNTNYGQQRRQYLLKRAR